MKRKSYLSLVLFFTGLVSMYAQTVLLGKVTDAETGDPIPFANVVIKGTNLGNPTDFDGFFRIEAEGVSDTLVVSYIGYAPREKVYVKGITQTINFQLEPESTTLNEVFVYARKQENPAFDIMRAVMENKPKNDKRRASAYEYDSYNKIEIDLDNISDKLKEKKYMQKISAVLDSIDVIAGEDGKPILPLFISESLSKFYYRDNPRLTKELIENTKLTGVGLEDGSLISQIIGSSFQQYNFYQNQMNIVEKNFASPIADGWRLLYDYTLEDSVYIEDELTYLIDFKPKNDQALAFAGKMWITKEDYAIKQIDASVLPTANLNFVEKIKLQQELQRMETGTWLPVKTRILIDVAEITNRSAGFLAKFYTSNENLQVTEPRDTEFFQRAIELAEDARNNNEDFWNANRHEKLSPSELNVISMIDTLRNIPFVKTWSEILKTFARGYVEVGQLDLGPWPVLVGANNIEGLRIRLGGRTNEYFSTKWQLNGYGAYGFEDEKFKYGFGVKHIVDRKKWTTLNLSYRNDLDQFGLQPDASVNLDEGTAFFALTQLGNLIRPFRYERFQFDAFRQFSRAFSANLQLRRQDYHPEFPFRYRSNFGEIDSPLASDFTSSEVTLQLKYGRDEAFIIADNNRVSLGSLRWPIFVLSITQGFKDLVGGDFNYTKMNFGFRQEVKMGLWGMSSYQVNMGHVFNPVPFTLLTSHIGNEQFVYTNIAFNTMDFFEFVSETHASLKYEHFFDGFILNKIPLIRKLKWRLVATGNVLFGGVSQATLNQQTLIDENGNDLPGFNVLEPGRPFAEVGIGIENIFRLFRIDYVRRLTYLDRDGVRNSDIKVSFNLSL